MQQFPSDCEVSVLLFGFSMLKMLKFAKFSRCN